MEPALQSHLLRRLYLEQGRSVSEIARHLGCSEHKVTYWLAAHHIPKRSISEALYQKHNPNGDPFQFRSPQTSAEERLFGLGLGIYWGEGTKSNKNAIRLGNTDPLLLRTFIRFLETFFDIDKKRLRVNLQIFTDLDIKSARAYWSKALDISEIQFGNPVVTKSGSIGNYRKKSEYGVATLYFGNTKARNVLVGLVPT